MSPVGGAIKKGVADGTYDDPWEDDQEPAKPAAAPQVWTFVASEKVDRALRKLKSGERLRGVTLKLLPEDHSSGANMRAIKLSLPSKKGRQAPTSSSLVRSKRTSPNDDIDDTWSDDDPMIGLYGELCR